MRKRIFGRRLKRDKNERKALFRSLMSSLVLHGKIRTTEAKAKAIKGEVEKLVTHAKNKGEEGRRLILSTVPSEVIADRIISEIAPKFITRPGGYTRILKVGARVKDGADMVILTWVEEVKPVSLVIPKRNKDKAKKGSTKETQVKKNEKVIKPIKKNSK